MPEPDDTPPGPYAAASDTYISAGWRGVLPLPARRKKSPPEGFTGRTGVWPSYADIHAWACGREGAGNVAIRLPHHLIGLDVDNYDDKTGAQALGSAVARWGELPATWRSTSRDDGISGIRLYRVPEGLRWPGELGDGTEIIQYRHRYVVAWPSIHPEGRTYRWIDPDGLTSTTVPHVDDLPWLPETWVAGLTHGEAAADVQRTDLGAVGVGAWVVEHNHGTAMCAGMARAVDRYIADIDGGRRSVHDTMLNGTARLAHMAAEGHHGIVPAAKALHAAFRAAAVGGTGARARTSEEANGEWSRALTGAVEIAANDPQGHEDPCVNPFAGILAQAPPPEPLSPPTTAPQASTEPEVREPVERTSWWPRDLEPVLAGHDSEPPPSLLVRDDDHALFYSSKVNGLLGESESGKTWIALLAAVQALHAELNVVYVDFEDTARGVVDRLSSMGVTDFARFTYIAPEESLHTLAKADLATVLTDRAPGLVVIDGVNAAMTLLGLDINSNNDATQFAQSLMKPIAATGAAVAYVDHLPKDAEKRGKGGIGAQAKRAMTTGCALGVDVLQPFGRGMTGKLRIHVDKDRPGHVRAVSAGARNAGVAVLTSDADTGTVTVRIEAPDLRPPEERPRFRPTELMARVSHFLATVPGGASGKTIEGSVSGKADGIRVALDCLVDEGFVTRTSGPRGAVIHNHVRLYDPLEDLSIGGSE